MRFKLVWVVLATLLVSAILPQGLGGDGGSHKDAVPSELEWWGPTGPDEGLHVRIPVTVTNPLDRARINPPVLLEIDLARWLAPAGWPSTASGDRDVLESFDLDMDSIRVVAMQDLQAPSPGSTHGRLRVVDPAAEGAARYEVASTVYAGNLTTGDPVPFDTRSNPVISVLWRAQGTLEPGQTRAYMVYLDTRTNGDHPAPDYTRTPAGAALLDLFWGGQGTRLYGYARSLGGPPPSLHLFGLDAEATATVSFAPPTRAFTEVASTGEHPNPVHLAPGNSTTIPLPSAEEMIVRVESDAPIAGTLSDAGFVPSLDAGMAGHQFRFALTKPASWERDSVYAINAGSTATQVEVRSIDTGQTYTFHLSDGENPFPYTIGARAGAPGGGCSPQRQDGEAPMLEPGHYEAQVVKGGPVLLQLPPGPITQVPSATGAPVGTTFLATGGWTSERPLPEGCGDNSRTALAYAMGHKGPSSLFVTSDESRTQVDPPQSRGEPAPDPYTVLAEEDGVSGPFLQGVLDRPVRDRPLTFHAPAGPTRLFLGLTPTVERVDTGGRVTYRESPVVPRLAGPLGGMDGARDFAGFGRTAILAPFPETTVSANLSHQQAGDSTRRIGLGADQSALLEPAQAGADPLESYHLVADQPLVVLPTEISSGALAAIPSFLHAEPRIGQFRGYLIDLRSPTGLDPVTASTVGTREVTFPLNVENLGRTADGSPLADTVHLRTNVTGDGWSASLDRSVVPLAGGETQQVNLRVSPDPDLEPGALGLVSVTARSEGNPGVQARLQTVTHIKSDYGVGLWFDRVNGSAVKTQAVQPGNGTTFSMVVQNTGSVPDKIELTAQRTDPGWSIQLLRDGAAVDAVELAPLASERLELRVDPPAGATDGILITPVGAQSTSSPAALDRATATTKIQSPSDLQLDLPDTTAFVLPGETAQFPFELSNTGEGSAEVRLDARTVAGPSWSPARVAVENRVTGTFENISSISLAPGDAANLAVLVPSSANATGGSSAQIRLAAEPAGQGTALEAFLTANIRRVHQLETTIPGQPLQTPPDGSTVRVTARVTNHGNLDELVRTRPLDLPARWNANLPSELFIPRNSSQEVKIQLTPPPHVPAGDYQAILGMVSRDGHLTPLNLSLSVDATALAEFDRPDRLLAQPGTPVLSRVPVTNTGNVPATVTIEAPEDEPWPLPDSPTPTRLEPGGRVTIEIGWVPPANAANGTSEHTAHLVLTPEASSSPPRTIEVSTNVSIGRAELSVGNLRASQAPTGEVVRATVTNAGDRAAHDLLAQLRAGEDTVDEVRVEVLPPSAQVNISFLRPSDASGEISVVLDPDDRIVEVDEANNVAILDASSQQGIPGPGVSLTVLVLCLVGVTLGACMRERRGER